MFPDQTWGRNSRGDFPTANHVRNEIRASQMVSPSWRVHVEHLFFSSIFCGIAEITCEYFNIRLYFLFHLLFRLLFKLSRWWVPKKWQNFVENKRHEETFSYMTSWLYCSDDFHTLLTHILTNSITSILYSHTYSPTRSFLHFTHTYTHQLDYFHTLLTHIFTNSIMSILYSHMYSPTRSFLSFTHTYTHQLDYFHTLLTHTLTNSMISILYSHMYSPTRWFPYFTHTCTHQLDHFYPLLTHILTNSIISILYSHMYSPTRSFRYQLHLLCWHKQRDSWFQSAWLATNALAFVTWSRLWRRQRGWRHPFVTSLWSCSAKDLTLSCFKVLSSWWNKKYRNELYTKKMIESCEAHQMLHRWDNSSTHHSVSVPS